MRRLSVLTLLLGVALSQRLPADELAVAQPKGEITINYCMS